MGCTVEDAVGRTPWSALDAIVRLFERSSEEADRGSAADEGVRPTRIGPAF